MGWRKRMDVYVVTAVMRIRFNDEHGKKMQVTDNVEHTTSAVHGGVVRLEEKHQTG